MMSAAPFLQVLDATASQSAAAETAFRREAAERIKRMERDRSFAFRRLTLMRAIADAAARAESEELAVAASQAVLRAKLGWSSDSEARSAVLSQFAPVAQAVYAGFRPDPDAGVPDVLGALAGFEAWYEETHQKSFWDLFEQPIPEMPLVDF